MGYKSYFKKAEEPKRGDIYWIEPGKKTTGDNVIHASRPGIIVSADKINNGYTYMVVFLTTTPRMENITHCAIRSSNKPSTALCDQVQAVSTEQIGSYIGTCTQDEMQTVNLCLLSALDLDVYEPQSKKEPEPQSNGSQEDPEKELLEVKNRNLEHEIKERDIAIVKLNGKLEMIKEMYQELQQQREEDR